MKINEYDIKSLKKTNVAKTKKKKAYIIYIYKNYHFYISKNNQKNKHK